jgi:hypothetical protein
MQYWYSAQLRQYRLQFIRAFSNFTVKTGRGGPTGEPEFIRVPCRYGDSTRIASSIVRGNSENKILAVPFISCYISNLAMSPNRRQDPQLVVPVVVNERAYNNETQRYTNEIGNRYTVERYMPVPYDLTMQVDIWSDNLDIKEQLLEQILVLYNPSIDIQTSVNPLDWTVLSYIEMQDSITWSSRSIPVGTDNPIDVASLVFKIPIWINPPAKVKKQSIIQQIVSNIVQGSKEADAVEWNEYQFITRSIVTPGNATIKLYPQAGGSYQISLCDDSFDSTDRDHLPTITFAGTTPSFFNGQQFLWNGRTITINHSTLNEALNDIKSGLTGTKLNCQLYNNTSLQFINSDGGDNIFEDIVPGSLAALGLQSGTYQGGSYAWWRLLTLYGNLQPYSEFGSNASQLRIKTTLDLDQTTTDIIGWISPVATNQNILIWTPDFESFPATSLPDITMIVNPLQSGPGAELPPAAIGQRYLLTEKPAESSARWGNITAQENDIIEFDGNEWKVSWSAAANTNGAQIVKNNFSGIYYVYNTSWTPLLQQEYSQGYWRLSL